ncbi:MAG TPA: VWA domain-containing protein [Thermoanaerobaculia bacterium]|jgi:VWFA-related protein
MRPLRLASLFLTGATAAALAATAIAQQPQAQPPQDPQAQAPAPVSNPTFSESVEVRVLDLDVDVTDSKGQPVKDLTRDDFTVKIGGKPVNIDYFSRVDMGTIHAPDLASASPDQVLSAYKRGEDAYIPRNFLIYVDLGYLPPGLRNRSLEAARDLITRMGPDDAARVVVFDRLPKVYADWTSSKETIFSALERIQHEGVGMSRLRAEEQTVQLIDANPRTRARGLANGRIQLADSYAQEVGAEIQTMLDSMDQEVATLTPLRGKKSFLFLTGGFEYQPGFVMTQYATGGFGTIQGLNLRDITPNIDAVVKNANANEITFYTVDATGLTTDMEGAGGADTIGAKSATSFDPFGTRPSVAFIARQDRQNGLQVLARETGGQAILNTNAFDRGLDRVYRAVSSYYSLGVNLSGLPIGKYQDVRVDVKRPGLTVASRRGFQPRPESDLVAERARATMGSDLSYGGIPVKLETQPPTPDKKNYLVPVTVLVPASSLTFVPNGDKATAKAEYYIGSVDDKGRMSDVSRQEASFQLASDKVSTDALVRFNAQLLTRKGNVRVVVNVRDSASGKMGTARANLRVE